MKPAAATGASYFGKLPARGDFVKGGNHVQLIGLLDRWTSACMEKLAENAHWKTLFDSAQAVDFAFIATHDRRAVIGHLAPSRDAAGRRFPFLAATTVEPNAAFPWACGPLGFSAPWSHLRRIVHAACSADAPNSALSALEALDCKTHLTCPPAEGALAQFARTTTLGELATMLAPGASGTSGASLRMLQRQILALTILLGPRVSRGGAVPTNRGLCLPLPAAPHLRDQVAALWLQLICVLLRDTRCELQLLLGRINGAERLVIGFNGASPRILLGVLAPIALADTALVLDDPAWVDGHPGRLTEGATEHGLARLASYLAEPAISLEAVLRTFTEVFSGASR